MKQMVGRIVVFVFGCVFACLCGRAALPSETAYSDARSFYEERLRFDFCGINGALQLDRGFPQQGVLQYYVQAKPDVLKRDREFYAALRQLELSASKRAADAEIDAMASLLKSLRSRANARDYWQYLSSVEYSLVRLAQMKNRSLGIDAIERLLPDSAFGIERRSRYPSKGEMHMAFRNMIAVSWALENWQSMFGTLPKDLSQLGLDARWLKGIGGADIEYRVVNGVWQLFSPGAPGGIDKGRFNEYIPVMDAPGVRFWPQSSCLWLSSEYSAKRRQLYETGTLYDAKSPCACKLERGRVVAQDRVHPKSGLLKSKDEAATVQELLSSPACNSRGESQQ